MRRSYDLVPRGLPGMFDETLLARDDRFTTLIVLFWCGKHSLRFEGKRPAFHSPDLLMVSALPFSCEQ